MDLTISIPTESEARVLDAMCRAAGHPPCNDQAACTQTQLLSMLTTRVTEYERFQARQAAAAGVPPLTL
ncbi:hypothetical protein [Prescottella equi]|uniref:hypothetical protein n=1 Tax=Rhodococcus hoagii TaxID=43767 RepID=UPI001EEC6660|nr:hypothetical protein [Prescottella equi]